MRRDKWDLPRELSRGNLCAADETMWVVSAKWACTEAQSADERGGQRSRQEGERAERTLGVPGKRVSDSRKSAKLTAGVR